MPSRVCAVTFIDSCGSTHTVDVVAESLFEAAVLAVDRLRRDGFIEEPPGTGTRLQVEVREPTVTHTVALHQVKRWLDEGGTNPAEIIKKRKLKEILG